jgi:acyl dehydratase
MPITSSPLFWEDFQVGDEWVTSGRTIGEGDVLQFAMFSGDWMPLHVDQEYAAQSPFGERIAHGILGIAIQSGLMAQIPDMRRMQPSVVALLGLDWKFEKPILFGDTLRLSVQVESKRETKNPQNGIVVLQRDLINQRAERAQRGRTPILLRRRPE